MAQGRWVEAGSGVDYGDLLPRVQIPGWEGMWPSLDDEDDDDNYEFAPEILGGEHRPRSARLAVTAGVHARRTCDVGSARL